jgi:hypothetical protein
MNSCEVCGNRYDKAFEVVLASGERHVFDNFECTTHALAPKCSHCSCHIIGYCMEAVGEFFCCAPLRQSSWRAADAGPRRKLSAA